MESWFGADLNRKGSQRTFFLLPGTVEYGEEADEDLEQEQTIDDGMDHHAWWKFQDWKFISDSQRTQSSSRSSELHGNITGIH